VTLSPNVQVILWPV